jgi:hypothetical protein
MEIKKIGLQAACATLVQHVSNMEVIVQDVGLVHSAHHEGHIVERLLAYVPLAGRDGAYQ